MTYKTARNPVIWADVPDPSVVRVGDTYYMSSTTMHMNPGVPIMKSKDLVNWEIVNYVYDILGVKDEQRLNNGKNEYGRIMGEQFKVPRRGLLHYSAPKQRATLYFQTRDIENSAWEKYIALFIYVFIV